MSESGGQRREPRRFVPPPWEQERFDQLERERRMPEDLPVRTEPAAQPAPEQARDAQSVSDAPSSVADEPDTDAMLAALKAQEPAAMHDAGKAALAVSLFVGVLGIMLVIWGMVALARGAGGPPAGIMGALIMSTMGGVLTALATWLGARGLKQRGERT